MNRFVVGLGAGLLALLAAAGSALAAGPGTHVREATRTYDLLTAQDAEWAGAAADPLALAYVRFGAIAPDFDKAAGLPFGHERGLSFKLLDDAVALGPHARFFALGHLCHVGSDTSVQVFVVPTLFSSAPLGMFDLVTGGDTAVGESEDIVESFGDLVTGDWDSVVDMFYDFWLDGDEAKQRAKEIFAWYCAEGVAYSGKPVDCAAAEAKVEEKLKLVEGILGTATRDDAKSLVHTLIDQPLPQLADLMGSPMFTSLGQAAGASKSARFDAEIARLKAGPMATPEFWSQYDTSFADLGPTIAMGLLAARPASGWPSTYDSHGIVSGNIESVLQFDPVDFAVNPGLIVDDVTWLDASGNALAGVPAGLAGASLGVRIRFFAALPLDAKVTGVVRKDRPGLAQGGDDVVGQADLQFSLDPLQCLTQPRAELTVPFTADVSGAVGFYLELHVADAVAPAFTTSWDRIWSIPDLDFDLPAYRDNFGTYGHWPPSLPVQAPDSARATLFVKVRVMPAGGGVAGVVVQAVEGGAPRSTGPNGIAVFDDLDAGMWHVAVAGQPASAFVPLGAVEVTLAPQEERWLDVPIEPIPQVDLPTQEPASPACLDVMWDAPAFQGQATTFLGQVFTGDRLQSLGDEADLGVVGSGKACAAAPVSAGTALSVRVRAKRADGSTGQPGWSPAVVMGGTPPVVESVFAPAPVKDQDCTAPRSLGAIVLTPYAPIASVAWKLAGQPWSLPQDGAAQDLGQGRYRAMFTFTWGAVPAGASLAVAVTNADGLTGLKTSDLFQAWDPASGCAPVVAEEGEGGVEAGEPGAEAPAEDVAEGPAEDVAVEPAVDAAPEAGPEVAEDVGADEAGALSGGRGGCRAGPTGPVMPIAVVFLAGVAMAASCRRRPTSAVRT